MTDLLPDERQIFNLGKAVEAPDCLRGGNFCYHLSIWFLTDELVDVPENATYNGFIRENLQKLKAERILNWQEPLFEATDWKEVGALDMLFGLKSGTYLIQLLDTIRQNAGHWVVLTEKGIFEPGAIRSNVPMDAWIYLFRNRHRVRRIFLIICSGPPRALTCA